MQKKHVSEKNPCFAFGDLIVLLLSECLRCIIVRTEDSGDKYTLVLMNIDISVYPT